MACIAVLAALGSAWATTPSPILTPTPTVAPSPGFTINGCVVHFSGCGGSQEFGSVFLMPLGRVADVDLGYFEFNDVPPGEYTLTYSPRCNPAGCTGTVRVTIVDGDVDVGFERSLPNCPECARLGFVSISAPQILPAAPQVGDLVELTFPVSYDLPGSIACGAWVFSSDAPSPVLAGDGEIHCDRDQIVVRRRAVAPGTTAARLRIIATTELQCWSRVGDGDCSPYFQWTTLSSTSPAASVTVGDSLAPCDGDCNADRIVTVDEILRVVLGPLTGGNVDCVCETCDGPICAVDCVLRAVNHALSGCPASP